MIEDIMLNIFHFFKGLDMMGAFLSMFIENIGIPLPTEIGYLISQDLINARRYSYPLVVLILTAGHLAGALVSYQIGRWGDNFVAQKLKRNKKITEVQKKLENWYARYGNLTIFITRFVGYVRPWSSFVAGFAEVKPAPFIIWTTLGSLIFNMVALYFSSIFIVIWRNYSSYHFVIALAGFILFFGILIYEIIRWLFGKYVKK